MSYEDKQTFMSREVIECRRLSADTVANNMDGMGSAPVTIIGTVSKSFIHNCQVPLMLCHILNFGRTANVSVSVRVQKEDVFTP